jgi:hypothetical protein
VRLLALAVASLAGSGGLTVGLSNSHPSARQVAVKLEFSAILECGRPIGPPMTVTLPSAERVPSKIAARDVLVSGSAAESVTVSRRVVTIKVARPEVICTVLSRGLVTIALTRAAKLGNPATAGTYRVFVHRGTQNVSGTFVIQK